MSQSTLIIIAVAACLTVVITFVIVYKCCQSRKRMLVEEVNSNGYNSANSGDVTKGQDSVQSVKV